MFGIIGGQTFQCRDSCEPHIRRHEENSVWDQLCDYKGGSELDRVQAAERVRSGVPIAIAQLRGERQHGG